MDRNPSIVSMEHHIYGTRVSNGIPNLRIFFKSYPSSLMSVGPPSTRYGKKLAVATVQVKACSRRRCNHDKHHQAQALWALSHGHARLGHRPGTPRSTRPAAASHDQQRGAAHVGGARKPCGTPNELPVVKCGAVAEGRKPCGTLNQLPEF